MTKTIVEHLVATPEGQQMMPVVYEEPPEDASFEVARSYAEGLPPEEFRLRDIDNKIPTPVDERGVVDSDLLIKEVMKTIKPEYHYPGKSDVHHGQWRMMDYLQMQTLYPASRAFAFRELAPNKMLIPRIFHNWIHVITTEPPMPEPEIMAESVREWIIFKNFFESVQDAARTQRVFDRERARRESQNKFFTLEQEGILNDELQRKIDGFLLHFGALESIPIERWPFSPHLKSQIATGKIGGLVLRGWQRRTRDVRRPDIASLGVAA